MKITTETRVSLNEQLHQRDQESEERRLALVTGTRTQGFGYELIVALQYLDGSIGHCALCIWQDDDPNFPAPYTGPRREDLPAGTLVEHRSRPQGYGCLEHLQVVKVEDLERKWMGY